MIPISPVSFKSYITMIPISPVSFESCRSVFEQTDCVSESYLQLHIEDGQREFVHTLTERQVMQFSAKFCAEAVVELLDKPGGVKAYVIVLGKKGTMMQTRGGQSLCYCAW